MHPKGVLSSRSLNLFCSSAFAGIASEKSRVQVAFPALILSWLGGAQSPAKVCCHPYWLRPICHFPRRPDVLCLFACPASRSSGNKLSWTCGLCWVIERDSPGRAFGRWKITFQLHVDGLRSEVWFRFRFEKFLKSFDAWNLDKYGFLLEELEKLGF